MAPSIKVYALSTCIHCKKAKDFLTGQDLEYDCVYVDRLSGDERNDTMREVRKLNPKMSFPIILIGDAVIVGFQKDDILKALGAV